jgi:urease accessory protein
MRLRTRSGEERVSRLQSGVVRCREMTRTPPSIAIAPAALRSEQSAGSGWTAELDLGFRWQDGRTVLSTRRHSGPLMVQRPFYPEGDVCHVYVLHPPGGIVGGDVLTCRIDVDARAHALVTTPAATKFYRSDGPVAHQRQSIRLVRGTCEWLPQEGIYFANARARVATRIDLDPESRFIGWDMACFGRPANGQALQQGEVYQAFELWREDQPLFVDRLHVQGGNVDVMQGAWGLHGNAVVATLLAYPARPEDLEEARAVLAQWDADGATRTSASLVDGVLVVRSLASRTDWVKDIFVALWQALRPRVLGRSAAVPRIWAT